MDRQVFRAVAFRRNGTENRVKQMAHSVPNRCRSISRVWAYTQAHDIFRFVIWPKARTTVSSVAKMSQKFVSVLARKSERLRTVSNLLYRSITSSLTSV